MLSFLAVPIATLLFVMPGMAGSTVATTTIEPAILTQEVELVKTVNKYGLDTKLEKMIKDIFGEDGDTMVAVTIAESLMYGNTAVNYNCEYTRKDGTKYSTSCRKGDQHLAWSVDCGLLQINQRGQVCDDEMFDPVKNINRGKEIYDSQGLGAWSAWKNGSYKKYIDFASEYRTVKS
jgi:hypothetical protein